MRDFRVNISGLEFQAREYEPKGEPLIFLHYGGGNMLMWQSVAPYFAHYRVILTDLRGHGRSDKPPQGYHIDDMAGDVVGIMDHLQLDRAHLVGSSLGAEVGLSLAARSPERVTALVCEGALYSEYGPYGIWEGTGAEFKEYVTRTLAEICHAPEPVYKTVDALIAANRRKLDELGWWNENFEAVLRYDACEIGAGKYARSWAGWARQEYLEHYFGYQFEEYYRQVQCPTLMLPAEEEAANERTRQIMQSLCALMPQGKIAQTPGAVHAFGWLLDPHGMSQTVLEFLTEQHD